MSRQVSATIAVMGVDIGKNSLASPRVNFDLCRQLSQRRGPCFLGNCFDPPLSQAPLGKSHCCAAVTPKRNQSSGAFT
jgi:hypothetical protein